jgi:dolichyl-phosphate-mannose-protein mannosyltransferase
MKPSAITVDFGDSNIESPPTSDFEEVQYPPAHSDRASANSNQHELPLHYMSEETARRRIPASKTTSAPAQPNLGTSHDILDDSKEKYRAHNPRLRYAPPPPPTTIVRDICSQTRLLYETHLFE